MERLNIGIDLEVIFHTEEVNESLYVKGVLFSLIEQMTKLNSDVVELILFSTADPSISSLVFESLSSYGLSFSQVIFTGGGTILPYLKALEVDVYLSVHQDTIREARSSGILSAYVSVKASTSQLTIVFDHRLFLDEITYNGLGKWVPFLGYLQQQDKQFLSVELMTTRLYSVDRWIKEFFQSAQCKVNAICFIASGRGDDLLELYDVNLYFEGNNDEPLSPLPHSECLLNIDF